MLAPRLRHCWFNTQRQADVRRTRVIKACVAQSIVSGECVTPRRYIQRQRKLAIVAESPPSAWPNPIAIAQSIQVSSASPRTRAHGGRNDGRKTLLKTKDGVERDRAENSLADATIFNLLTKIEPRLLYFWGFKVIVYQKILSSFIHPEPV